ncbi:MAG: dienelactone hydrolase [Myxococcaceae bacterium]|nr:dienelactone hydrolase [Myxococcaceae bacterium]
MLRHRWFLGSRACGRASTLRSRAGTAASTLALSLALCAVGCTHVTSGKPTIEASPTSPKAGNEISTRDVSYEAGDTHLKGFLASPVSGDKHPGVLIAPEWWGLSDHARDVARKLAESGYVALALDMYGDAKVSEHPADAKAWMMELMQNPEQGVKRFEAGKDALLSDSHVDPQRIAAIGYCMGGAIVLQAARRGDPFKAIASLHGNYATQTPLVKGEFPGKIFIAHGEADSMSTNESLAVLKQELDAASANYEIVSYPGAKHGFTNPKATELGQKNGLDLAYDPAADAQSWAKLQEVLAAAFK